MFSHWCILICVPSTVSAADELFCLPAIKEQQASSLQNISDKLPHTPLTALLLLTTKNISQKNKNNKICLNKVNVGVINVKSGSMKENMKWQDESEFGNFFHWRNLVDFRTTSNWHWRKILMDPLQQSITNITLRFKLPLPESQLITCR